jgi:hypothetical protein
MIQIAESDTWSIYSEKAEIYAQRYTWAAVADRLDAVYSKE